MDGHERYFHHPTGLGGQEKPFATIQINTETDADHKPSFTHDKICFEKQYKYLKSSKNVEKLSFLISWRITLHKKPNTSTQENTVSLIETQK